MHNDIVCTDFASQFCATKHPCLVFNLGLQHDMFSMLHDGCGSSKCCVVQHETEMYASLMNSIPYTI